ncbi:uncharacterized protein MYCFIDRAFT_84735 [Pseudocercospora fijiensis CIRAD86]|uniref:RdRp catalytic domain-containing protein n=1 Tax=Pseudocercospora fijiensis (strain CIRAD86) TaxID=383855 RepID=M3AIN6_PSEFD|nr:uncharacterized protein MYCFIDRAFT_84735 [Pseudocercospora fijiensis CIRAD86]EME77063.1 hypothetical protein MYCFIDRAFT_84735 [Pseudocercospora fijiensis CIRAD86]
MIRREEQLLDAEEQHRVMVEKYREKERKLGGRCACVDRLDGYLRSFKKTADVAEGFGFLKLWGHPYVDPVAGCESAKKVGKTELNLSLENCKELEHCFCHMYTRGYLQKRGRWPPLEFTPRIGGPTQLELLYKRHQPSLAFGFTQYPSSDWNYARFLPHVSFDYGEDILRLVVDKSLSYERQHFDHTWNTKLDYKPERPNTSSRVMEELISRPDLDLASIVEQVAKKDIPYKWRIVTVCPKEREMKLQPRMFSMMTLEMRLFFVLTEHNIAEGIFKSLPEQTMTLSRTELLNLFLKSTEKTGASWVRAVLGIDFERWNLYWRKEVVHRVGFRMDQIYGTAGVFSVVHDFFESSLCMLRMPDYPPDNLNEMNRRDPPEGRTLWYNHKGGFEGIAQKLWTTCTICLVHMALWPMNLSYRIIGQGDNQHLLWSVWCNGPE